LKIKSAMIIVVLKVKKKAPHKFCEGLYC